jgi:glycosyltransferase involved in cell wall biosynthesis
MQFFIKEIMPAVRRAIPDLRLTIVGRSPYRTLVELAQRDNNIAVTGRVEDVRPYIEEATAFIVPIRIGGGTRLKIYEAMAMEKPVISTTVGAEGLPVRDGVELLLADDPKSFADAVVRVLTDASLAGRLGRTAAELVRQNFGWRRASAMMADVCQTAIRDRIS